MEGSITTRGEDDAGEEEEVFLDDEEDNYPADIEERRSRFALRERPPHMQRLYPSKLTIPASENPLPSNELTSFFSNIMAEKIPSDDGEEYDLAKRQLKKVSRREEQSERIEIKPKDLSLHQPTKVCICLTKITRASRGGNMLDSKPVPARTESLDAHPRGISEETIHMTSSLDNPNETPSSEKPSPSTQSKFLSKRTACTLCRLRIRGVGFRRERGRVDHHRGGSFKS